MARAKDKGTGALKAPLATVLLLRDATVVKSSSERLRLPELAARGRIKNEYSLELKVGERRKKTGLVGVLSVGMSGWNLLDDKSSGEQAFVAKLALEGFFELEDQDRSVNESDIDDNTVKMVLSQLVPVASLKVRDMAIAMGYANVRQPIGFSMNEFDVSEVESSKELLAKKDTTKVPRKRKIASS